MTDKWETLPESLQLHLAREAFSQAFNGLAHQTEGLAREFDAGTLADRGAADALRLLAAIVRSLGPLGPQSMTNLQPVDHSPNTCRKMSVAPALTAAVH